MKRAKVQAKGIRNERPNGKAWSRNSSRVAVAAHGTRFSRRIRQGWELSAVTGLYGPVMTANDMHIKYGRETVELVKRVPRGSRRV